METLYEEWSTRTTAKQRVTGRRLLRALREEGYKVGITVVADFLREKRRTATETFVPLVHRPGDSAQVDFFEVHVVVEGERRKVWMFLMRLMHSGKDFAWLYEHADQVSFLDGHVRAFAHFGGVPARCVYDNLSAAVRRVLFPGRQLTQRFTALCSHYLLEPCFARPGVGHDKGGVESRGKGIRLQHLVPVPEGRSLDELGQKLLDDLVSQEKVRLDCEGRSVEERFAEEQPRLRELPEHRFEPRVVVPVRVNRKALFTYDGATYSVPSHWKLLEITAYVGPNDLRLVCRSEVIRRARVRRRQRHVVYTDYLQELRRKPQALRQVAPELTAQLGEPFAQLWHILADTHGGREAGRLFAKVLEAVVTHGTDTVGEALQRALADGRSHLLALGALLEEGTLREIDIPESLRAYVVEATSAKEFDRLLTAEAP